MPWVRILLVVSPSEKVESRKQKVVVEGKILISWLGSKDVGSMIFTNRFNSLEPKDFLFLASIILLQFQIPFKVLKSSLEYLMLNLRLVDRKSIISKETSKEVF